MTFKSSAQKYRPQRWGDVLDQEVTVKILRNAIKLNRIPSAFFFTGQKGTGKTSTARLIAKTLNCNDLSRQLASNELPDACDDCSSCVNIRNGNDSEVLEIDAASHGGVDDTKEITNIANQEPAKDKWRIVIIDECHSLSKASQNALLALFEAPPRAFLPILCTTDVDKVLPTILSRCMKFVIKPISPANVRANLARIFAEAKQPISNSALLALSRTSQGSLRDIQQVADQLISAAVGAEIDDFFVEQYTGIPTLLVYRKVAGALMEAWSSGPEAWFELTEELALAGADFHQIFFTVLSNLIRDFRVAICSRNKPEAVVPYHSGIDHKTFQERLTLSDLDVDFLVQSLDDTARDFGRVNSSTARFHVEFFFLRAYDAKGAAGL
jgi:DNA polymerase-3 subunit gamma/tau